MALSAKQVAKTKANNFKYNNVFVIVELSLTKTKFKFKM